MTPRSSRALAQDRESPRGGTAARMPEVPGSGEAMRHPRAASPSARARTSPKDALADGRRLHLVEEVEGGGEPPHVVDRERAGLVAPRARRTARRDTRGSGRPSSCSTSRTRSPARGRATPPKRRRSRSPRARRATCGRRRRGRPRRPCGRPSAAGRGPGWRRPRGGCRARGKRRRSLRSERPTRCGTRPTRPRRRACCASQTAATSSSVIRPSRLFATRHSTPRGSSDFQG